jgi:acyl-CoA dehydrogenase
LEAITEHAVLHLEKEAHDALKKASDIFSGPLGPVASTVMKMGCFPLTSITRPYYSPGGHLTKEAAHLLTTPSGLCDMAV